MEGDCWKICGTWYCSISIHSLRMEGDTIANSQKRLVNISIHSLRMEGDHIGAYWYSYAKTFQSTPSAWRETQHYFQLWMLKHISIHSLRMEGDLYYLQSAPKEITKFQSTPSAWRETCYSQWNFIVYRISIHSLRMEGDKENNHGNLNTGHFNPLPPHGGRLRRP